MTDWLLPALVVLNAISLAVAERAFTRAARLLEKERAYLNDERRTVSLTWRIWRVANPLEYTTYDFSRVLEDSDTVQDMAEFMAEHAARTLGWYDADVIVESAAGSRWQFVAKPTGTVDEHGDPAFDLTEIDSAILRADAETNDD